jgi:hypothetical protein
MEVKIRDTAFTHTDYSTLQKSKYFSWTRTNETKDVCFFTDGSIHGVLNSNDKIKVCWLIEPRSINSSTYKFVKQDDNKFDYVLTYDSELLAISDKYLFYPHGGCWLNDDDKQIFEKTKGCSIIASSKSQTDGHKLRHAVVSALGPKIDTFGSGYIRVENKITALKDYKFSIVIENSKQDDYFTEKLIDTLLTGTIPLYWGTDKINKYFTNIPTFNTIEELELLLNYYSINDYPIDDIKNNFDKALKYTIPEDFIYENYPHLFK